MRWFGRETGKSKKTNKVSIPAWPASLKYIGTGWRVLKARSLWRCLPGRQPTEGHGERAWILPLGFAHSPLGPQNSNDFLFSFSNVGLLTRIMMKQIQRNITRHKEKANIYLKNIMDILDSVRCVWVGSFVPFFLSNIIYEYSKNANILGRFFSLLFAVIQLLWSHSTLTPVWCVMLQMSVHLHWIDLINNCMKCLTRTNTCFVINTRY